MKVLFYNHTGQVSGAERVLLMILARLDQHCFDPLVICPEQGPLLEMVTNLGVPVESLPGLEARFTWRLDRLLRYLKSFFFVIRHLRRKVVSSKPDLIHANSIRAGLVATAATLGLGTKVVWHLHDLLPRHPLSSFVRVFAFLSTRARMIAVSQAVANNFHGALFPLRKRVSVILNVVELEEFGSNQNTRQQIREEFQLTEAELLIGIVGQLTPRKGQLELLRAFARALKEIPRAVLIIVGAPLFNRDDEYAQLLKETAAELGIAERVRMVGERRDVPAIMRALDLVVINSSIEPFGLVALEAMGYGTPILAAVSGGIPELIEHNKNGWLVPQGDEQVLAAAIVNLSRQPELRAQFAQQGKQHIAARFSVGRYMEELEAFYHCHSDPKSTDIDKQPGEVQPGGKIRLDIGAGGIG
jgi:glycosyltransferase involved in cell wall biosynthesis